MKQQNEIIKSENILVAFNQLLHGTIDKEQIKNEYNNNKQFYEKLKDESIYILKDEISKKSIKIHEIVGRVKELDSLTKKCETKNLPFDKINDICGVRVICLYISDLQKIEKIITDKFVIITKDDKINNRDENSFGYMSVHYICNIPVKYNGTRYDNIKNINFEIQLRTIAMHAWAEISHHIDYKTINAIPSNLRKDFNALSALFYIVDSHFEMFYRASIESKTKIEYGSSLKDIVNEEMNLDTLTYFLEQKYPNRESLNSTDSVNSLLANLISTGFDDFTKLDYALNQSQKAFEAYEEKYAPDEGYFANVGVIRISLAILNVDFRNITGYQNDDSFIEFEHLIAK